MGIKSSVKGLLVIRQTALRLIYEPRLANSCAYSSRPPGYLTLKFIVAKAKANDSKSSAVKAVLRTAFLRIRVAVILWGASLDQSHIPCAESISKILIMMDASTLFLPDLSASPFGLIDNTGFPKC